MISIEPDFNSIARTCDWIELYILCDSEKLSKSKFRRILTNYGNDVSDTFIADTFAELHRRQKMMGEDSVFMLAADDIIKRSRYGWEDVPEYVMCLIFSLQGVKKIKGDEDGTKLFERIGRHVISAYLDGEAIVLGFPNPDGKNLNEQLIDFATQSNEIKSKDRVPANTDKDKGVDIIGWKPHFDGRENQVILLIQAAAGYHWDLKKPISENAWRDFFMWSAPINKGIIIAGTLDEINFRKAKDDYDLVFDRIRIFISLYKRNLKIDNVLRELVKGWCTKELNIEAA